MIIFYNISLKIYYLIILIVSPFNKKAKQWISGRKNIFERIKQSGACETQNIWFHVSSLGEYEQGLPVIEKIKLKYPNHKIFLTFFSPSGYEIKKNSKTADYIFYLPNDSRKNARKFIELVNPQISFFVKYDFWYHYLNQLKNNKIPIYIFSTIFRKKQSFFKWYGAWYRKMLYMFTHVFVQNKESVKLLKSIGIKNVTITGDTRFDRVIDISENSKNFEIIAKFKDNKFVIIAGSTWQPDEEILINFINNRKEEIKFIIAPHNIKEENIKRISNSLKVSYQIYSKSKIEDIKNCKVLIIDNIGMLSSIYKYGEVAYIGGGFGVSIHNTLEAVTYGMPVVFGTNYHKFQEAKDLIELKTAFSITNYNDFESIIINLFNDNSLLTKTSTIAKKYVYENKGSTDKIIEKI